MSLNNDDIAWLMGALYAFIKDFDSGSAIADETTFIPVWTDFDLLNKSYTRNNIAAKLDRYYDETSGVGTPAALGEV